MAEHLRVKYQKQGPILTDLAFWEHIHVYSLTLQYTLSYHQPFLQLFLCRFGALQEKNKVF